jgi:hypothetical protein
MDSSAEAIPGRKDFLLRIVEQFRELADEIGAPFHAEAYLAGNEAVLRVDRDGQEDHALRVVARFADDNDGVEEKLVVLWEDCQGEVTRLLGIGWREGSPDAAAGLDRAADHLDKGSAYAIGKVTSALRDDVFCELNAQSGLASRIPPLLRHSEPSMPSGSFDREERSDPGKFKSASQPGAGQVPPVSRQKPDIELLQVALGELATKGGLQAENVFAGFIKAARSPAALKQGDVVAYAQGALLELSFFYAAFLRSSGTTASDLGMEGGHLRDAVVRAKAAFFERDEAVRWQVTREMITGMRLYFAEALASKGVPDADANEMLRSIFGRGAAITKDAMAILAEPEATKRGGLASWLLGRNGMD